MKFYFSAATTFRSFEILKGMPDFRPLHLLHTQFERKQIENVIPYIEKGEVEPLFIDSGAYSVHTGKVKLSSDTDIDGYAKYLNSIDKYTHLVAQLDHIPGKYHVPKTPEDYVHSAEASWEMFKELYYKLDSPEKLIYVYHQGEPISALENALKWRDNKGNQLGVIGLSGQGDSSEKLIRRFMIQAMRVVQRSDNPKCRTHLFGIASDYILNACQPYSSDSTTHLQIGVYGKILIPQYHQPVIVSDRQIPEHPDSSKDDIKLLERLPYKGGEAMYQDVKKYIESLNLDMHDVTTSPYYRTAVNMHYLQRRFDHIKNMNEVTHGEVYQLF